MASSESSSVSVAADVRRPCGGIELSRREAPNRSNPRLPKSLNLQEAHGRAKSESPVGATSFTWQRALS